MTNENKLPDYYFIAIGGVGQSALAKILLSLGYCVFGSDVSESKYTKLLTTLGAKVFIGHNENNLIGRPKVIVSSAIKEDNPELIKARALGLEIMHRSDCLAHISSHFPCFIGLSGTHGKTTMSGLISFVMDNMDLKPTFAVGGIIPKIDTNAKAYKNSKYFIAELDESDGTIVKYSPDYLVINNLEADHLDHYKDLDDVILTFEKFISNLKDNAKIFLNIDNIGNNKLNTNKIKTITYAVEKEAYYSAKNIIFNDLSSSFDFYKKDELIGKINLIIPGMHNIYNALAVLSVLDDLGFKYQNYFEYFSQFSGMGRRFQLVADINNIKIIDDYAHHPSEIKSTLKAIKDIKKRKIVIFQPHRYTRLKALWNEFLESFHGVDELYVLDTYGAFDGYDKDYNSKNFTFEIAKKGIKAQYIEGPVKEAAKKIAPKLKAQDIVLTLGAGDVTKIGGEINDLLSK